MLENRIERESDLSGPVLTWLESQGFATNCEVPFYQRSVDIVGVKVWPIQRLVAVEMKMVFSSGLIRQARDCRLMADLVYVAIPTNPIPKSIATAEKYGIGVLRVAGKEVSVLSEARPSTEILKYHRVPMIFRALTIERFNVGGLPCQKGRGPAQDVAYRVRGYLQEHPRASWRNIFIDVANHYCSHTSMSQSLTSRGLVQKLGKRGR